MDGARDVVADSWGSLKVAADPLRLRSGQAFDFAALRSG